MAKIIQTPCNRCHLHKSVYTVGMVGWRGADPKLLIFVDYPHREEDMRHKYGNVRTSQLLFWLLERMSVDKENVAIDFILKCSAKEGDVKTKANRLGCIEACSKHRFATLQSLKPLAVVAMGKLGCEAFFNGKELKHKEGCSWTPNEKQVQAVIPKVWSSYSPGYALQTPAETTAIYRILFAAAKEAGLEPEHNPNVKHFDWEI